MARAGRFRTPLLVVSVLTTLALFSAPGPLVAGERISSAVHPLPYRTNLAHASSALERAMLNLINQERAATGLVPLMPHATLRRVARAHALEMFAAGALSHRSLDGRSPQQRVLERRVRVRRMGENLAYAPDVLAAHEALMASDRHRQNILSSDYDLIGIGVLDGGLYGVIVVQDFADAPFALSHRLNRPGRRPAASTPRSGPASAAGWVPVPAERRSVP